MKKVLFVNNVLYGGGAEKSLIDIVNNLDKNKYKITVLTYYKYSEPYNILMPHIKYKYMYDNERLEVEKNNSLIRVIQKRISYKLLIDRRKYQKFFDDNYDVVIAFKGGMISKIVCGVANNAKIIGWIHEDVQNWHVTKASFINNFHEREMYKKFDSVVAVSKYAKNSFEKVFNYSANTTYIYNGVNLEYIKKLSQEPLRSSIKNKYKTICCVSRLSPEKGILTLLKSYKKLTDEGIFVNLWIVGDGLLKQEVEKYIDDNNLNLVKLWGEQRNPYNIMAKCDIYVCPSETESFGISVVEALVLSLPVITTMNGGVDEVLNYGEFGLIKNNNVTDLYMGLQEMIENENVYNKYRATALLRAKEFSIENTIQEVEKLLDNER